MKKDHRKVKRQMINFIEAMISELEPAEPWFFKATKPEIQDKDSVLTISSCIMILFKERNKKYENISDVKTPRV